MTTATINVKVPKVKEKEYKKIFTSFVRNYSLESLKKIENYNFYDSMLDWVFDEKGIENNIIPRKNWKLDLSVLSK